MEEINLSGIPEPESFVQLTQAIFKEINRVFPFGFSGHRIEYAWLLQHYGITEYEDVCWQFFIDPESAEHELSESNPEDKKLLDLLYDEDALTQFLNSLLTKYRSSTEIFIPN